MKDLLSKEHYFYKIYTLMKQRRPPYMKQHQPIFYKKTWSSYIYIYIYNRSFYIIYKSFVQKTEEGNRLKYIKEFFAGRKVTVWENLKVVNAF